VSLFKKEVVECFCGYFYVCKIQMDSFNLLAGDHCKAFEFLCEVSTLPRFDTIALFLTDAEKKGKFPIDGTLY